MFTSGLLILSLPPKLLIPKLREILSEACLTVHKRLYVKVDHRQNLLKAPSRIDSQNLCFLAPQIYSQASKHCSHLDVRVLQTFSKHVPDHHISGQFQVVLSDTTLNLNMYLKHQFNVDASKVTVHSKTGLTKDENTNDMVNITEENERLNNINQNLKTFDTVCLGGTFDRLHNGHKVLLSEAINLCTSELVIGVTDGDMIKNKVLYEMIEPSQLRMDILSRFLSEVNPALKYRIEPIYDPFGPAITVPQIKCLVVSQETLKGGVMVNNKRVERGLSLLEIHEVHLLEDGHRESESEEDKISSSSLRRRCLGTIIKEPTLNSSLPHLPYLIGLTGGIASGKSSISRRLQALGVGVLDCDQLAHLSYSPGTSTYNDIIKEFGHGILAKDKTIDRKLLGAAAFGDNAKREKLNSLVWPATANLTQSKIKFLYESGHKVIVLEVVLLLEAGWKSKVHQVWVSTVPEKEAVKRVVARDGLSEESALARIKSQMSNVDRVAQANLVFSTLWEPEETQKQVERAWTALKDYLQSKNICRL